MILIFHIFVALASLALSTVLFFAPSVRKLHVTYGLVALTLGSGTYLVAASPAHMLQACVSGLSYLAAVSVGIVAARYKLARVKDKV